jgi:hypothetical protein
VGQDAVTLVLGLPLLLASMWLAHRGSARGLLLWAGALFYFAYSYYFYVTGGFNALFLVYAATVSTSLYGLLSLLFAVDLGALKARFATETPVRLVGGFMVGYALLFAFMWVGMTLASVAAGTRPDEVVRSVVAIDCAVLLPLLLFGGAAVAANGLGLRPGRAPAREDGGHRLHARLHRGFGDVAGRGYRPVRGLPVRPLRRYGRRVRGLARSLPAQPRKWRLEGIGLR